MRKKIKTLQIIRGLAFLGICLGHFGDRVVIPSNFSGWGVTVFFIMSGFLNMIHGCYEDSHNSVINFKYAVKKIRKLYPLIVVTTVISLVLETYHYKETVILNVVSYTKSSIIRLILNLSLISNWFPKSRIFKEYNIVVWFISTLFLFYFFTPFLGRVIGRLVEHNKKKCFLYMTTIYFIDILLSAFFWMLFKNKENAWWFIYENPLVRVWEYLLGMFLASLYIQNREELSCLSQLKTTKTTVLMLMSCLMTILMWLIDIYKLFPDGLMSSANGFFYTIPVMGLVYSSCMFDEKIGNSILEYKFLYIILKIGDLSVYAYLIHVPIINATHAILWRINMCSTFFWCVLSLTLIFACSVFLEIYCFHRVAKC